MSDLISRSAVLKQLEKWKKNWENTEDSYEKTWTLTCIDFYTRLITNQPTAYDIEKVVAELNEATIKIAQKYLDMVDGKETQSIATYNEFVLTLLNRIMKQIRKGGVE